MTTKNGTQKAIKGANRINQEQHHDRLGAQRGIDGSMGHPFSIIDASAEFALDDYTVVRVATTTAGFIWIGLEGDAPAVLDATNSMQVLAGTVELFHSGYSEDCQKSVVVKASGLSQLAISSEES